MPSDTIPEGYFRICTLDDLEPEKGIRLMVNDEEIAVFFVEGKVYVVNNICPHQHSAILYKSFVEDGFIACPAHGWKFNLETGKKPDGFRGITSFPVIIDDNVVYSKVVPKTFNW